MDQLYKVNYTLSSDIKLITICHQNQYVYKLLQL